MTEQFSNQHIETALAKWAEIGGLERWGAPSDLMLVRHGGRLLAWPRTDEVHDIFDVATGQIVDEEQLPSGEAQDLAWTVIALTNVMQYATR